MAAINGAGDPTATGINSAIALYKLSQYMGAKSDVSETMVILSLGDADGVVNPLTGDLNVGIGTFRADSAVGGTADLTAGDVMGSIYMSNVNVTVDGIVAIAAVK